MTPTPICDIVIPIWNQPTLTGRCLVSIEQDTTVPVRLILVDNGSAGPTRTLLEDFRSTSRLPVILIRNEGNLGFIRASNQGIQQATAPWVCLLNNDTVVTQGWLSEMIRVAESDPKIGLVNPASNSLGLRCKRRQLEAFAQGLKIHSGQARELNVCLGFCLLSRRSFFETVGLLDESFGMGNFDDDDLSRRAKAAGFRCVMAPAAYVLHEEKASFRRLPRWQRAFDENRARFEARWGRNLRILWAITQETTGHPPLDPLARELTQEGHWIYFIDPSQRLPARLMEQAQISRLESGPSWRARALWRLLTKRKKPFDLVVSDDAAWSGWVRRFHPLHGARLLHRPCEEELKEQCRILSRSRSWSALEETRPLPAAASLPLSVVVIAKNEAGRLAECLESVRWAGEIIVVDDESTDSTLDVARRFTKRLFVRKMEIEGAHRNWAYAQAAYPWVFSLDADERVTPELAREIRELLATEPPHDVYAVPRRNYIGRHWIRHGGWYPSAQVKLFKKTAFRWEETTVHPRAISDSSWGVLKNDLIHHSYRDLADFVSKLNRQTTLEAQKWARDRRRVSLGKALWRTADRFLRSYVGKRGYRDGAWGVVVAAMAAAYQILSYAKYWEYGLVRADRQE